MKHLYRDTFFSNIAQPSFNSPTIGVTVCNCPTGGGNTSSCAVTSQQRMRKRRILASKQTIVDLNEVFAKV